MSRHSLLFTAAGGLSLALACGNGGRGGDYSFRSSSWGESGTAADEYGALDQAYVVAPDRAVLRVDVSVLATEAATASAQLRSQMGAVTAALSDACPAQVLDYTSPRKEGEEAWRGSAELRLDIPLAGLGDVSARMQALDACNTALASVLTSSEGTEQDSPRSTLWVFRSAEPVLLVDAPQQHAPTLLARRAATLAAVADASAAPQLHPEDLRCTATGDVQYGSRRLSGVQLTLGMDCRVVSPPPPQPPPLAEALADSY